MAWKISSENGSANYDIYNDEEKEMPNLFPELRGKTTLDLFREEFKEKILNGTIQTNEDAYYYTLEKGFSPEHAKEILKNLKKSGEIYYNSKGPLVNYKSVVKKRRIVEYEKDKN
jgi:DNA replicative helicase MCM subunit Mcm2 (Cdc46/Mcm family)